MNTRFKELLNYKVIEMDAEIGHVYDITFDDQTSEIKYLVIDTGSWLKHHLVLLNIEKINDIDNEFKEVIVNVTKNELLHGKEACDFPAIEQRLEESYRNEFGPPTYWHDGWGAALYPAYLWEHYVKDHRDLIKNIEDTHLHSVKALLEYEVRLENGELKPVVDVVVHTENWKLDWIVKLRGNLLMKKEADVPMEKVRKFDWANKNLVLT